MQYILDTSAIIRRPQVLSRAAQGQLLVPTEVIRELLSRGRDEARELYSSLLGKAFEAGAMQVDNAPGTELGAIPVESIRRLSGADIQIVTLAAQLSQSASKGDVAIVTLDRDIERAVAGLGILCLTPEEFLERTSGGDIDEASLASANKVLSFQKRHLVLSALLGAGLSFLANIAYQNAAYLLETLPVWGPLVAIPAAGVSLFWYRQRYRLSYGVFEFIVGVLLAYYAVSSTPDGKDVWFPAGLQVLASLYVMVRGMDNIGKGLEGTRLEGPWKRVFRETRG